MNPEPIPRVPAETLKSLSSDEMQRVLAVLLSVAPMALCATDAQGHVTYFSRDDRESWGLQQDQWRLLLPDGHEIPADDCPVAKALREREAASVVPVSVHCADGSYRVLASYAAPVGDSAEPIGAIAVFMQLPETADAERLLISELTHRLRNFFAVASMLVRQSVSEAETPSALADIVERRLAALARAHNLALPGAGGAGRLGTSLQALFRSMLAPYQQAGDDHYSISGLDFALRGGALSSLALMVYELCTNALKYGALSLASGRLQIEIREADGRCVIDWRERSASQAMTPSHEGAGLSLLRRLASNMGGACRFDWGTEGLSVELSLPRSLLGTPI